MPSGYGSTSGDHFGCEPGSEDTAMDLLELHLQLVDIVMQLRTLQLLDIGLLEQGVDVANRRQGLLIVRQQFDACSDLTQGMRHSAGKGPAVEKEMQHVI